MSAVYQQEGLYLVCVKPWIAEGSITRFNKERDPGGISEARHHRDDCPHATAVYRAVVFADLICEALDRRYEQIAGASQAEDPVSVITSVTGSFLYIYFLAWLLVVSNTQQMTGALELAFVTWLGMVLPTMIVHYERLGYPWTVVLIDSSKELVCALMTAAILVTWR